MLPVEPRPVVIGTMGLPSVEGADALGFLPKMLAALNLAGVNSELPAAPSAVRNERRFQPSFKPMRSFPSMLSANLLLGGRCGRSAHIHAADDFNQRIARNPFQSHAGTGRSFAGGEIGSVDLVQRVVLRLVRIEPGLAGRHGNSVSERQTKKNLEMDDAVHVAACTLDRFLERVHGPSNVFFERIRHQDVILLRIAVIGTRAGEVIDTIMCMAAARTARRISARCAGGHGCAGSRSLLLTEDFQGACYQS